MLGKHLLSTVWLYTSDVEKATRFYHETLGLPFIGGIGDTTHFDAGNLRISLHPWGESGPKPVSGSFLVFYIERGIDGVYKRLARRGVRFSGPLEDAEYGRVADFRDPDGHHLYIWQPPRRGTEAHERERPLIEHYEKIAGKFRR